MVSAGREHDTHDDYTGAAARLLTLGEKPCHDPGPWADYVTLHGLTRADVPQLIRMARDPALNEGPSSREATWAPVHAWRALGQLRAVEASAALLEHLRDSEFDEFVASDFPEVLEGFGHEAIPAITAFLASEPLRPPAGAAAMNALRRIAQRHPAHRSACVAALTGLLAGADRDGRDLLEAYAIVELVDLAAVESIEAIRAAFARGTVDLSIQGDIEEVEIQLGLRRTRDTPKPRFSRFDPADWPVSGRAGHVRPPAASPKSGRNDPCPCGSGKKFKKCCLNLEFS